MSGRQIVSAQIGMTASPHHLSGTDRYYLELLQHLPTLGVAVSGMVIGEPEKLDGGMPGVRSFAAQDTGRIARWRRSREVFREIVDGADLIVSHGQPHAFPVLDLMQRKPLVVQWHGPWALEAREEGSNALVVAIRMYQERAVYRRASRFIVLSAAYGAVLCKSYGVDPSLVRVVPGGVDLPRFTSELSPAEARLRLDLPTDRPLIVTTRRLEPTKGVGVLVEAVARIRDAVPDVLCIVAGSGSLRASLESRVAELRLGDAVRFLGHVDTDILRVLYRAADISVVPSVAWEGFGLSVPESLASGTPVVSTDSGGLPEVLADLDPTLIVPRSDVAALASRVVAALGGAVPTREACMTYAARFGWPEIARRVADVYREVLP